MTNNAKEDARLEAAVDAGIAELATLPSAFRRLDGVHHAIHDMYAERAVALARYLKVAIDAIRSGDYSPGYALLRSAFEHHLVDHLFLRGDRYVVQGPTTEAGYQQLEQRKARGEPGTETIVDMSRNKGGHTRIVHRGPYVTDPDGKRKHVLSIYFAFFEDFDPLVGPPDEQRYIEVSWRHLEALEDRAREQQRLYGQAFTWPSIRANLELNDIYAGEQLIRLNVHHRFLSGFTHNNPTSDAIVQGKATSSIYALEIEREHPARELGHLYAAALAARELDLFLEMAETPPRVGLVDRDAIEATAKEAHVVSRHLWFPGDAPHPYDIFHRMTWEAWRRPGEPTAADVNVHEPYYRNPFDRLKEMHRGRSMGPHRYEPAFFIGAD